MIAGEDVLNGLHFTTGAGGQPALGVSMRFSDYLVLGAAGIALALSVFLWFGGSRDEGLFVAVWVPSILTFATYIKVALRGGR